jgi:hypothetical protein
MLTNQLSPATTSRYPLINLADPLVGYVQMRELTLMSITRRFLLAPSLARLIEKERGGHHVNEGYFPDGSDRSISVRIEQNMGTLVLTTHGPHEPMGAPVELPRAHAEALLALAAGGVDYQRIDLNVATHEAYVSRLTAPGVLDLIAIDFEREEQARGFEPPCSCRTARSKPKMIGCADPMVLSPAPKLI